MDAHFLNPLIQKYKKDDVEIYIADSSARIIASSDAERIGNTSNTARYITTIRHAAAIQSDRSAYEKRIHYGVPVIINGSLEYIVVTYGNSDFTMQIGTTIHAAMQTALEYQEYQSQKTRNPPDEQDQLCALLLSSKSDKSKLLSLMYRHELDPNLMRVVIDIKLDFYKNEFFNINLNLGYESSIEKLRTDISRSLKKSRFLNSQDLLYVPDCNTILIIKSFLHNSDISRMYLALEEVCKDLVTVLNRFNGLSFSIAYGNFYHDISEIHTSWKEAAEMLEIGNISGVRSFYSLDSLLLDCISLHLLPQIEDKYILPLEKKLTRGDGQLQTDLVANAEAFVDNCLSVTAASQQTGTHRNTINSRLKQFTAQTGLNPSASFKDAFLSKMLALHLKRKLYYQSGQME